MCMCQQGFLLITAFPRLQVVDMPHRYGNLRLLLWQVKLVIREEAFNRKSQSGVFKLVRVPQAVIITEYDLQTSHRNTTVHDCCTCASNPASKRGTPVDNLHIVKRNLQVNLSIRNHVSGTLTFCRRAPLLRDLYCCTR